MTLSTAPGVRSDGCAVKGAAARRRGDVQPSSAKRRARRNLWFMAMTGGGGGGGRDRIPMQQSCYQTVLQEVTEEAEKKKE
jgi:hypothetical protein